jgi:ubiquinone/menaquinone biosynthesis C-methylase UbiE
MAWAINSFVPTPSVVCGSALTCSLLATVGASATGIDISQCALNFAQDIATEFGVQINTIHANWLSLPFPPDAFDAVFSLGALEHYPLEMQRAMLLELVRVSRKWIVVLVPNVKSPIYRTMEEREFATMPLELVYPEENYLYEVDLVKIAQDSGLSVIESSALHIVPPRIIPERYLTDKAYDFFGRIVQQAQSNWNGNVRATWQAVESAISMEEKEQFGWFSYAACKKNLIA